MTLLDANTTTDSIQAFCALATLFLGVILAIHGKRRSDEAKELEKIVGKQQGQLDELINHTAEMRKANTLKEQQNLIHQRALDLSIVTELSKEQREDLILKLKHKPNFIVDGGGSSGGDGKFDINLKNNGKDAYKVKIIVANDDYTIVHVPRLTKRINEGDVLKIHGEIRNHEITVSNMDLDFTVEYHDALSNLYRQTISRKSHRVTISDSEEIEST